MSTTIESEARADGAEQLEEAAAALEKVQARLAAALSYAPNDLDERDGGELRAKVGLLDASAKSLRAMAERWRS